MVLDGTSPILSVAACWHTVPGVSAAAARLVLTDCCVPLLLWLLPPAFWLPADTASTAAAYAKLRAAEEQASDKGKASLWQLIFGSSDNSSDSKDTIKAAAGKARPFHQAKPLVTAAA